MKGKVLIDPILACSFNSTENELVDLFTIA